MRRVVIRRQAERGDTIIEVLFAVAVFAMIAVGSLAIMNQGTVTAQRSLEITLVRQQIYAQSEALRYIHAAYVAAYQQGGAAPAAGTTAAEWVKMTSTGVNGYGVTQASPFGQVSGELCPANNLAQRPFILNARTAKVEATAPKMSAPANGSLPPFAQVVYSGDTVSDAYGIWIEAVPARPVDSIPYVDFHIRTCWNSPGSTLPMTLGTIVRLYDPTN